MNDPANSGECAETKWIRSYRELTDVTESQARNVYMYVGCKETLRTEGADGWLTDDSIHATPSSVPAADDAWTGTFPYVAIKPA
jgi:hypothetical protein